MYKAAALTAAALIFGSATFAQTMSSELKSRLEAEGYTEVEMHEGKNGQVTVNAMRNGEVVRLFFDAGTGADKGSGAGASDKAPGNRETDAASGKGKGSGGKHKDKSRGRKD
ncbi:hypothetical protein [Tropicimonas sp. IMCC34011]|uniref:hypothetical protein n=1 Tax=Tropicimonas sp. IMCC34011 TaxID=2248759 RepID=UPI000E286C2D|nr:hypothetical protein [Tropicimonas sp. IMCC34011]